MSTFSNLKSRSSASEVSSKTTPNNSSWDFIYQQVPLVQVPGHFAGIAQSPYMLRYLSAVLQLCPRGGRALETGIGSGYGSIWLSLRGIRAEGLDLSPVIVERATQVNTILGGKARFHVNDLFDLYQQWQVGDLERYDVIFHQGVLEHFSMPYIRAALAQQVACANHVIFSVPSVYYPFDPEFGDERLLSIEDWRQILEPFDVQDLCYAGDPQHGGQEQILITLRGQEITPALLELMEVTDEPFPDGITAIVHTRNEAARIEDCLKSLQSFADEIIVCDMESEDATIELARPLATRILHHPLIPNFDRARNVSAMHASYRWIFYLDADERVPPRLGPALRQIVAGQNRAIENKGDAANDDSNSFAGMLVPFRHHFAGHWMRCLYPGYTAPRLLRNGKFVFNARLHSGAHVDGPIVRFPADDPDLALVHYSYDNLSHYLGKLNRYTDGEALNMHRDGAPFHWQNAISHFVRDFQSYYEHGQAVQDGVHGFLYSFLSGFYRFEQHAKLYERRFHGGQLQPAERAVPANLEEMLEFALRVARDKPLPAPQPILVQPKEQSYSVNSGSVSSPSQLPLTQNANWEHSADVSEEPRNGLPDAGTESSPTQNDTQSVEVGLRVNDPAIVWSGPLLDPSGYGEESRNFVFGLDEIGVPLAAQVLPWSHDVVDMPDVDRARLEQLCQSPVPTGFTHIVHNLAPMFNRHPAAGITIGRTMFETDRLPQDWVRACQNMDYLWVPSEFHRRSFIDSGIAPEKLAVIPEGIDTGAYFNGADDPALLDALEQLPAHERELLNSIRTERATTGKQFFLSVFDWTLHKGWDVLLRSFIRAFEGRDDAVLLLRVWSTMNYGQDGIQAQASQFLKERLGHELLSDNRIRFIPQRLSRAGLCALYASSDAFVLPSRGEGWGRPYMEAMASGKPTIGTSWSGNAAFMTSDNSFLLDAQVRDVPERGWRELPTYKGHRWAEPNEEQLVETLRLIVDDPTTAAAVGNRARTEVLERFDRQTVARQVAREIKRVQREAASREKAQRVREQLEITKADVTPHSDSIILPETGRASDRTLAVRWEGALFNWHSLGHVNRELLLALQDFGVDEFEYDDYAGWGEAPVLLKPKVGLGAAPAVELSLLPTEPMEFSPQVDPRFQALAERVFAPLPMTAHVHVRHFFPPRFGEVEEGQFVLIQPWEYGYLPEAWIDPILNQVSQVWCHTNYLRDVYLNSGIPAEKLRMVPLGIDPQVFRPDALPYVFTDEPGAKALHDLRDRQERGTFVFLYAGGTIHRKGFDILLEAYRRAFTSLDNVCLVIKDTGTKTVYRDANGRDQIMAAIQDERHPDVVYLDGDLPASQMAGVFAAADCLVAPYRGEGFCLPVLEAMACGTPVLVTKGGPTDDFVDETVGWRIEAEHRPCNIGPSGKGRIGRFDCVGPTWTFEVDPDMLALQMRRIAGDRSEARKRGASAAERARTKWTWRHAARHALAALQELAVEVQVSHVNGALSCDHDEFVPNPDSSNAKPDKSILDRGLVNEAVKAKPTISLCMIVRDEERVLDNCLSSAKPWFDEIILVDTGSTDRTVQIAGKHGAKVFHFPWCDDFSAARNESLRHATGDWVFWMDADDTMPPECGAKLHDLALLAEDRVFGFIAQVHIPAAQGETGFTIVDHVKLFRNRSDLRFIGRIHEQILEPIQRAGGLVERGDIHIVHSGYDYSPQGQEKKRHRDLTILEKDLADRPDHPFVLFNIGMTAYHMKEYDKAQSALERCLMVSGSHESTVRKVYAMLAGCHAEQGQYEAAKSRIEQGLDIYPYDPELLFRAGIVYRELGDYARAERSYLTLLQMPEQGHVDSLDVTMTGFKARHNLALIYRDQGNLQGAEQHFRAAVGQEPKFVPSWLGLSEVYLQQGRLQDVDHICHYIEPLAPQEAGRLRQQIDGLRLS